jgi:hypothetical protein
MSTPHAYETDIVAWAQEQVALLRAGNLAQLDLKHIAEEIEDVGKSEQRELANRLSVLLAHLLKWQFQASKRSKSWQSTIKTQRREVMYLLAQAPSLKAKFADAEWFGIVWAKAKNLSEAETGLDFEGLDDHCPWPIEKILEPTWLPE